MEIDISEGSKWHVISMFWVNKWRAFTYYDHLSHETKTNIPDSGRPHPGRIDNSDIILEPPK